MGPVIGASVVEKGNTSNGVVTDFDGNFTINVKPGATLVISYIGYTTQEVPVGNQANISITMQEDNALLDEVVVVGYGVQKKKLVTGATVQVKGEELSKLSTTSALTAMQSQTPGVQIVQNNGQAGDGFKINIRGISTTGSSAPLVIVDGIAGGDLNALNPSDIESIDVLKDAASAAIYGARAANGVILVTTKQGKVGQVEVSYDGYVGWQYLTKKADVLDAQEYMYAQNLKAFNGGPSQLDWQAVLPANIYNSVMDGTWNGTNWIDESYKKGAMTHNHALNVIGGSELSKYSLGVSYTNQDGIFGGRAQSNYERYTARLNSEYVLWKSKAGDFDVIKIGEFMNFNHIGKNGLTLGNMYANNIHDLMVGNPLLPAYNEEGNLYTNPDKTANGWAIGNAGNPLGTAELTPYGLNESKSWAMNFTAFLEIQPIKDLIFKTQFGYKYGNSTYRSMEKVYSNGSATRVQEAVNQNASHWSNMTWENTLAYTKQLGLHNLNVVVGNAIEKQSIGGYLEADSHKSLFGDDWNRAYISNTAAADLNVDAKIAGYPGGDWSLASFFGRISYNFDEKYMAQFTMRADGSSNFMRGNRWGYFPSASLGWVVTNEKFMEKTRSWLDFLKIRGSWGQNGNQDIGNFYYLTTFSFDSKNGYYFGLGNKTSQTTGAYANVLKNEDVTWETSEQLDLGIDARFIGGRLGLTFDWYQKKTKDWLVRAPIQAVWGLNAPYVNGGDVENTGIEVGLTWNDRIGKDFTYGASVNFATNKNEVTRIANAEGIIHGTPSILNGTEGEIFRAEVGKPIGYFWGYKTAGVFQNQQQIDEWKTKYTDNIHQGNLTPGDVIFQDISGPDGKPDGIIDAYDKTEIGDPHPDVNIGFNVHAEWKGFDFSVSGAGAFGHQIVRTWDNNENSQSNLNKKLLYGSWKGEGTSNLLPKLSSMNDANWVYFSSIWVEDADYVKIQNVTFGYDFARLLKKSVFSKLRLYVAANNLFTFSDYSGMDPEVGSAGDGQSWGAGIDNGFYPSPRTYLIGANITFKGKAEKKAATKVETKTVYVTDNAELDRLNAELNRLRAEKANQRPTAAQVIKEKEVVFHPYMVNFEINKTEVVNREKVNLQAIADMIKANPGKKFRVAGYADSQTGTTEGNAQLAMTRAQNVYNLLVNQYGVKADSLVVEAKGEVDNLYFNDAQMSRSVIVSEVK